MSSLSVKPDKCAILQEAVNQIRSIKQQESATQSTDPVQQGEVSSSRPTILSNDVYGPLLLEALEGFLFVVNSEGKVCISIISLYHLLTLPLIFILHPTYSSSIFTFLFFLIPLLLLLVLFRTPSSSFFSCYVIYWVFINCGPEDILTSIYPRTCIIWRGFKLDNLPSSSIWYASRYTLCICRAAHSVRMWMEGSFYCSPNMCSLSSISPRLLRCFLSR